MHDQSNANREAHETRQIMDIEAAHDLGPVCLNGLDAEVQPLRNGLARVSFRHQLQDLALTWRQSLERADLAAAALDVGRDDALRDRRPILPAHGRWRGRSLANRHSACLPGTF